MSATAAANCLQPAPEDVRGAACRVCCRCFAVEHERQRPASPKTRHAGRPDQLVPERAGVCGVAPSVRRLRLSQRRTL